jgi:MHS family proline/betaine transporter-like MFS transporter
MTHTATVQGAAARPRRTVLLASLGGALEYYDFVLYGIFTKEIGQAFFPAADPLTSQLASFLVFAVGFFARPIGGLILGPLGDRFGRRGVFLFSMLVVSLSTLAIGLLPGYASWGVGASVCLVLLRVIQGFCLGGELPGATAYAVEAAPRHPGLACGVVFALVNSGVLAAALVSLAINLALPPAEAGAWGWRIGFMIGGGLGLVAMFARRALEESPAFTALTEKPSRHPFIDLFKGYPTAVLIGVGVMAATAGFNGLLFAHMRAHFSGLGYDQKTVSLAQNVCLLVGSISLVAFAALGDRIPRRRILRTGAVLMLFLAWPFYIALANKSFDLVTAFALAGVVSALFNGTFAAVAADFFPTRVRYTGIALVMNLSFTLFGSLAPYIVTYGQKATGDTTLAGPYLMVCAAVTLVCSLLAKRWEGRLAER